jgi:hypothetical protein
MKQKFANALSLALIVAMLFTSVALASDVAVAVVDVTAPTGSVTLLPGQSGPIVINLTVSGQQDGTATFSVYRDWTLFGGVFSGSNPQTFTVPAGSYTGSNPRWTASTTGTVTIAAGETTETRVLAVSAFNITNSNSGGAKLADGTDSNYQVIVSAPAKTTPTITWVNPADITYGTALGTTQLNATASVAGTFTYTPAAGTVLNAGNGQTLHVDFVPSDTTLYNNASKDVTINVLKADPGCSISGYSGMYDGYAHGATGSCTGQGTLDLGASFTDVPGGTANWSFTGNSNYNNASGSVQIAITQAASQVEITCPSNETYTGSPIEPCSASATGVGGLNQPLTVSYSNNVNAGTATASASYAGDTNHTGSNASKDFTIDQAPTTTVVTCAGGPFTYTGSPIEPCSASVTGAGGLSQPLVVSYLNNVNAGTATASASYAGDANHLGSNDSEDFMIDRASSTTTVTCAAGPFYFTGSPITPCSAVVTGVGGLNQALTVNYSNNTAVGTATASANYGGDANHYGSSDSKNFSILAWTLRGFYQPVDMNGVFNTVKNGSTVPLKFEIFVGTTKITDVSYVKSLRYGSVACSATAPVDDIETLASGNTSLRYDATAGQFIYNWKTPAGTGCYSVTMTTNDGSTLFAFFKLK